MRDYWINLVKWVLMYSVWLDHEYVRWVAGGSKSPVDLVPSHHRPTTEHDWNENPDA